MKKYNNYAGGLSLKISLGKKVTEGEWLCTTNLICTINYFVFIHLEIHNIIYNSSTIMSIILLLAPCRPTCWASC